MNIELFVLIVIAILLAYCGLRLTEISGELQDVAARAKRFYPLTASESEEGADADEADAWHAYQTKQSAR